MSESAGTLEASTVTLMPENREVELKLLTDPRSLASLAEAPIISRNARTKGTVKLLEATYYDTRETTIAQRGAAFRVRRAGKKFTQTLKIGGADPLQRIELEVPVPSIAPKLDELPLAELGAPFNTLQAKDLVPIFTTKIRRHIRNITFNGALIEMAFDEGQLIAGDRTDAVCEAELELKSGEVGALYEFALSLLDHVPFHIGTQSKGERGYALAFGTLPSAGKGFAPGIEPTDTTDQVITKTLAACQRHALANLAAAQHGHDPHGVHQLRVALRRLRSAISLFAREIPASAFETLKADARFLASALGPARNWDVFLTETIPDIGGNLPGTDFTELRTAAAPFRARAYEQVAVDLASLDATRLLLSLGKLIERRSWRNDIGIEALTVLTRPARELADRALLRINRKALKQGRHLAELEPEARHELRLTLKKLRYSAEFFLPLYETDAGTQKYLKSLTKLQNVFGADNDATTTQLLLDELETGTSSPQAHKAIGAIAGWLARDRIEAMQALEQDWERFIEVKPFWQ